MQALSSAPPHKPLMWGGAADEAVMHGEWGSFIGNLLPVTAPVGSREGRRPSRQSIGVNSDNRFLWSHYLI